MRLVNYALSIYYVLYAYGPSTSGIFYVALYITGAGPINQLLTILVHHVRSIYCVIYAYGPSTTDLPHAEAEAAH